MIFRYNMPAIRINTMNFLDIQYEPERFLYAAIGEPSGSSYASSCLGPGEDGELYYDGFTVYTYKENDSEIVKDVE